MWDVSPTSVFHPGLASLPSGETQGTSSKQGSDQMAMRAVLGLLKFDNLVRELKAPRCLTIGVLEMLWHFTAANSPRGDVGRHSNQEIASWIGWEGNADQLIAALEKTHWLDPHPKYRLSVHHWSEHADKATRLKLRNKGWVFVEHEELTLIPKESSGSPDIPDGRSPGAGAVPGAGAGETPDPILVKAAELTNEFVLQGNLPDVHRPEFTLDFADRLRTHGIDKADEIMAWIKSLERPKRDVKTPAAMFVFWSHFSWAVRHGSRSRSGHAGSGAKAKPSRPVGGGENEDFGVKSVRVGGSPTPAAADTS